MTPATTKSMDDIVALCKRRGFIYPASEIYGGINGFWDFGPLGTALKNNLRDAWWRDVVMHPCGAAGRITNRRGAAGRHLHHPAPAGLGRQRALRDVQRPHGRLPRDQGAVPLRHLLVYVAADDRETDDASKSPENKPYFAFGRTPSEAKQKKKAEKAFGEVK
jgi:hypothetical protein